MAQIYLTQLDVAFNFDKDSKFNEFEGSRSEYQIQNAEFAFLQECQRMKY